MNPKTGEIREFSSGEKARAAGFTVSLDCQPDLDCKKCWGRGHVGKQRSTGKYVACPCTAYEAVERRARKYESLNGESGMAFVEKKGNGYVVRQGNTGRELSIHGSQAAANKEVDRLHKKNKPRAENKGNTARGKQGVSARWKKGKPER